MAPTHDAQEEAALLMCVFQHLEDDTPRLVYADWLDERDDPRGPAVRAEVAARRVLPRRDVHGILDVWRYLGISYTDAQLSVLGTLPWPDEELAACAGSHVLVAGGPVSVLDLQARHPSYFWQGSASDWYADEPFARDARVEPRWHLIRKQAIPDSANKTFSRQEALLPPGEAVPRACEVSYATVLHHQAIGEWLLPDRDVRCADMTSHGARVHAGRAVAGRLYVGPDWHDGRSRFLGLTSARAR